MVLRSALLEVAQDLSHEVVDLCYAAGMTNDQRDAAHIARRIAAVSAAVGPTFRSPEDPAIAAHAIEALLRRQEIVAGPKLAR